MGVNFYLSNKPIYGSFLADNVDPLTYDLAQDDMINHINMIKEAFTLDPSSTSDHALDLLTGLEDWSLNANLAALQHGSLADQDMYNSYVSAFSVLSPTGLDAFHQFIQDCQDGRATISQYESLKSDPSMALITKCLQQFLQNYQS